jgi:hypothetical protein
MHWLIEQVQQILEELPAPGMVPKEEKQPRAYTAPFGSMSIFGGYTTLLQIQADLLSRYQDYEAMDEYTLLHSALDIYADDATKIDLARQHRIWIEAEDESLKKELETLLYETLKIEQDLWQIARTLGHYGNDFGEIGYDEKEGVVKLFPVQVPSMRRIEDVKGTLLGFVQDYNQSVFVDPQLFLQELQRYQKQERDSTAPRKPFEVFEPWEMIHWRMMGSKRGVYGESLLEASRWAWRRLVLLEDSAIIYKLTRSPARFAFYIDTTGKSANEAMAYVQKAKMAFQKKKIVNASGQLDFKSISLAQDESFWVPTSNGKDSTRIEMISGADWQSVEDLEYFRQMILSGVKIPAAYLGIQDGDTQRSLAQQDVRFSASVERLQQQVVLGLTQLCRYHLMVKGLDPNQTKWNLVATPPSSINELAQIEARAAKADLAARLMELVPMERLLSEVLGYPENESKKLVSELMAQRKTMGRLDAEIQADSANLMNATMPPAEALEALQQIPQLRKTSVDFQKWLLTKNNPIRDKLVDYLKESRELQRKDATRLEEEMKMLRKELRRNMILGKERREPPRES